ncbi:hypothetical protein [Amaricoccus tamworthensis]|uniref:hypothetical protein n=1 Tax=Amaricoccus tamworthensis TaxID=57002 RepID=UPI003C7BE8FE
MSVITNDPQTKSILSTIGEKFETAITWCEQHSRRGQAAREAAELLQKSDEELASMGLTRNGVVQHCFGPYLA